MQNEELKNMSVKLPLPLHAEVKEFIEKNSMTMSEFVIMALQDELHPKYKIGEENNMSAEKTRVVAIQVPEAIFQKLKEYLQKNQISQKQFLLALIQKELGGEQSETQAETPQEEPNEEVTEVQNESPTEAVFEDGVRESRDEELTEEAAVTDEECVDYAEEEEQGFEMSM